MAIDVNAPESIENTGGSWLTKEGMYHFLVNDINEHPKTRDHRPIENALGVQLQVLAGTNPDQFQKTIDLIIYMGRKEDRDGGEFARKKLWRFLMAIGLINQYQAGTLRVETSEGIERQLCAKIAYRESSGGKKYLDVSYADFWHVDDIEAKDIPKHPEFLNLIPASNRKIQQHEVASLADV